ncbi:MAG: peptide deformylase [Acidimicrobiales bacterium]
MAHYSIRVIGDPVLKQRAREVTDIDGKLVRLVDDMFTTMYEAPGVGLAAPQVGVQKRLFVYDHDGVEGVLINPEITESGGEWEFNEGCLSIPGIYFEIHRPKDILITGVDLDGNDVQLEVSEFEARVFQHELDHLDGVLMTERINDEQRKQAKKAIRELMLAGRRPEHEDTLVIAADGTVADHR